MDGTANSALGGRRVTTTFRAWFGVGVAGGAGLGLIAVAGARTTGTVIAGAENVPAAGSGLGIARAVLLG
jgi:hypothetical protein